jgi:hypothetical protein
MYIVIVHTYLNVYRIGQRILKDLPRKFQLDVKGHFLAYGHGLDSLGNRFLFAIIKWGQHFAFLSKNCYLGLRLCM